MNVKVVSISIAGLVLQCVGVVFSQTRVDPARGDVGAITVLPTAASETASRKGPYGSTLAAPRVDTLVVLSGYNSAVPLTWRPPVGPILGYNVYRGISSGGPYQRIANGLKKVWYRDEPVANGTVYYYVVTSVDGGGESAYSPEASGVAQTNGYSVASVWTTTSPAIDGVINASEWGSAVKTTITSPGGSDPVTIYVMNDGSKLYLAIDDKANRGARNNGGIGLFFDTNHDRVWPPDAGTTNEGVYQLWWDGGASAPFQHYANYYAVWPDSMRMGSYIDPPGVLSNVSNASGNLQYEASFDLSSSFLAMSLNSTFGMFAYAMDFTTGNFNGVWPQENIAKLRPLFGDAGYRWAHGPFSYGDVKLAPGLPPVVMTTGPTNVGATGATLTGSVNPNGLNTSYQFEYGLTTSYGLFTSIESAGSGSTSIGVSATVTGLTPSTTYHYRLLASSDAGTAQGGDQVLTTGAPPPTATTTSPTNVGATGATLTGTVNPNGVNTSYQFEYGLTTGYGSYTSVTSAGSGNTPVAVNATVTGLTPNTTYHYRLLASSDAGRAYGGDQTLTTTALPPTVTTTSPTSVGTTDATITGIVNPNGLTTNYRFEYGQTTSYGTMTSAQSAGSGNSPMAVNATLTGLATNTTYHYRLVASSTGGLAQGGDQSFTTGSTLAATPTLAVPSFITISSFKASWGPAAGATGYRIDVATDVGFTAFVGSYNDKDIGNVTSFTLTGLQAGTAYYCRIRAYNVSGVPSQSSNTVSATTLSYVSKKWTQQITGTSSALWCVDAVSAQVAWVGGMGGTVLRTTDAGAHWNPVTSPKDTMDIYAIDAVDATTVLVGAYGGSTGEAALYKTTNGGSSWNRVFFQPKGWIGSVTMFDALSGVLLGDPVGNAWTVYFTNDGGSTWSPFPTSLIAQAGDNMWPNASFWLNNTTGWFGSVYVNLFKTTDGGANWSSSSPSGLQRIRAIAFSDNGIGLAVGNTSLLKSQDLGSTWTPETFPTSSLSAALATRGGIFWLAAQQYVFVSTDAGVTWITEDSTSGKLNHMSVMGSYPDVHGWAVGNNGKILSYGGAVVPGPATALAATSVSSSAFVANWSAVSEATGYRLDVATDAAFTSLLAGFNDRDVGNVTSFAVSGLSQQTQYYYRLRAVNAGGTGPNSNVMTVVTLPNAPAAPTATSATNASGSGFTANWTTVTGATGYRLDVASDNLFASFASGYNNLDVGNVTSYVVGGLTQGTTYFYRVRATNTVGSSGNSNTITVTTTLRSYPATYVLANTTSFTTHASLTDYVSDDYRLVGLPGNPGNLLSTYLDGQEGTAWEAYWDNGKQGVPKDYYVKYDGSATFQCSPGKAFWILHIGDWTISNRTVNTAPLDGSREVAIPLTSGQKYNLITNPFDTSIPWSTVAAANGINDSIRAWAGYGWTRADLFEPYRGYLFFNSQDKSSVRVPFDQTAPLAKISKEGWRVDVIARSGKYIDQTTSFGVSRGSRKGFDTYEQRKPRRFAAIPDVYFDRKEWDPEFNEFATDIRPEAGEIEIWEMTVRSEGRKPVELEFSGIHALPDNLAVYLVDGPGGRAVDLRKGAKYLLKPATESTVISVVVGKPEVVSEFAGRVTPTEIALLLNYPNPFNPSTTIPLTMSQERRVVLEIYSLLGQRVRTLYDGVLAPGRFTFEWDGKNDGMQPAATGVYLCSLRTGDGIARSRRIVLLK